MRWSEHEARKPYARPFMVTFVDDAGTDLGSIAVNGADLLYQRQFVAAVAELGGELLVIEEVEAAADPQLAWLDVLAPLMSSVGSLRIIPASSFDHESGRRFGFLVLDGEAPVARVEARTLLEYQELQAAVAHQAGRLLRDRTVEAVEDPRQRQRAWTEALRCALDRPAEGEAMAARWPWR